MKQLPKWAALALGIALTACTTTDKYSFIRVEQTTDPNTGRLLLSPEAPVLSDGLALNYASSVASVLRSKFNGTRITNEVASTIQVTLAALAGAGAAFDFGASIVAGLALGSAGIPELQKIFDAKGRTEVFQDAVRLIEEAEIEYLSFNQNPSNTLLTQNGVTLFQRVTASIHLVEKTLAGRIPSLADTQKAVEPMSREGAVRTQVGAPAFNNIPANGGVRSVQKLTPVVINSPVKPGAPIRADDIQAVVKSAGDTLRQLSKEQAQKALEELKPGAPESADPQEEITEMLVDTTTFAQAMKILKSLQNAK
jgi:hypothetical protein